MKRLLASVLRSFGYAFRGVLRTIREERNFRIHLTAVVFVSWFSFLYGVTPEQAVLLVLVFFNVLAFELFNTALEDAVDTATDRITPLAGRAKDAAAGGVLLAAVAAVVIAVLLFRDPVHWLLVRDRLLTFPRWLFVLIALIAAVFFIRGRGKPKPSRSRYEDSVNKK